MLSARFQNPFAVQPDECPPQHVMHYINVSSGWCVILGEVYIMPERMSICILSAINQSDKEHGLFNLLAQFLEVLPSDIDSSLTT